MTQQTAFHLPSCPKIPKHMHPKVKNDRKAGASSPQRAKPSVHRKSGLPSHRMTNRFFVYSS